MWVWSEREPKLRNSHRNRMRTHCVYFAFSAQWPSLRRLLWSAVNISATLLDRWCHVMCVCVCLSACAMHVCVCVCVEWVRIVQDDDSHRARVCELHQRQNAQETLSVWCATATTHRWPSKWNMDFLFRVFLIFVKSLDGYVAKQGQWRRQNRMDEWQAAQFSKPFPMYKYILLSSDVYLNIFCTLQLYVGDGIGGDDMHALCVCVCNIQSGAEPHRFIVARHLVAGSFVWRRCNRCGNQNCLHRK